MRATKIRNKFVRLIHNRIFSIISLIAIAGLVLGIYGGIWSSESADLGTNALLKASVICFVAAYVAFGGVFLVFLAKRTLIPAAERPLLYCFAYCVPFMIARFLYSILPDYVNSLRYEFNALLGNVSAYLFMAVLEEIIIVAIYIYTGMRLGPLPQELKTQPKSKKKKRSKKRQEAV